MKNKITISTCNSGKVPDMKNNANNYKELLRFLPKIINFLKVDIR